MDNLNSIISQNLKKIREDRAWSLDKLAQETGVSKSMLGQIERGESNPTVATVWKISQGLKVSFTTLIHHPQNDPAVLRADEVDCIVEDDGGYLVYPYFNFESGRNFELYKIVIAPGGKLNSESHSRGTMELLIVFNGTLTLEVSGKGYTLAAGDSIQFKADQPHAYYNNGEHDVELSMTVHYMEGV
ncbi:helix-turn-helix transcriptional regulator [Fusibacter paucivorans]|uniref:Helix-turn-helix transcriptional regulator n=1 Tax=Fusibacter paucivorans TaxID=76009 RepID=A0ABS5PJ75_9FIRM|nr:XRE family transcriptional regulator [Fusibacter paucivorans]MBS7525104.1 helix-turn-helix transcriptional regulator [Fusibacter paucivorans]